VLVHRYLQEPPAIFSHLPLQGVLSLLSFRKALQFEGMDIPIKPVRTDVPKQPVRSHFCEFIQARSQALSHTFQATQPSRVRQHKRRIRALLAPGFEPPVLAAHTQYGFQQEILRLMVQQALTKVHKNAGIKTLIIQRQGKRIFPIQSPPNHLGGLSV
jgi:hypothetical protein